MRNLSYLYSKLTRLALEHFPEIDLDRIELKIGRRARTRLGSIRRALDRKSIITLNGLFTLDLVPDEIIDATLAHELCHYVHGFSSALPQQISHPHRGGVVDKEMISRGLGHLVTFQKRWIKENWPKIIQSQMGTKVRIKRRKRIFKLFFYI